MLFHFLIRFPLSILVTLVNKYTFPSSRFALCSKKSSFKIPLFISSVIFFLARKFGESNENSFDSSEQYFCPQLSNDGLAPKSSSAFCLCSNKNLITCLLTSSSSSFLLISLQSYSPFAVLKSISKGASTSTSGAQFFFNASQLSLSYTPGTGRALKVLFYLLFSI